MNSDKPLQKRKIGLQAKSVLILAVVVFAATTTAGWMYYSVTSEILQHNDHRQADRLAGGLGFAAVPGLRTGKREMLHQLVTDLLNQSNVHYARILDSDGEELATAERVKPGKQRYELADLPASMSYELRKGGEYLELGRPVVVPVPDGEGNVVIGAVRLVINTGQTTAMLAVVQREISLIAAMIILCGIPLGHLLAWQVFVMPVRRLLSATRRLAEGDFSARVDGRRNDQTGELASSFDVMAERLDASQRQLRDANELLEQKVAARTAELARANDRLRDEMAEKEDFLRAVSHDLNAPLRNIAGMATMVCMKWRDQMPEEALARLQRIQANVDTETDLINELLELSRIRTRRQQREEVDFRELLEDLGSAFEFDLQQRNISFHILGPMPTLHVERSRMRELFQNLIDNAIKYMGDRRDGRIEIGYEHRGAEHLFHVADNGPGIDPEDKKKIFHVFRRASAASSAKVQGKGVGLAWVKSIVANYQGRLWVESTPGEGSTFFVALSDESSARPPDKPDPARAEEKLRDAEAAGHIAG